MKVLMINRPNWQSSPGGDAVQMLQTAAELRKLGVEVEILGSTKNVDPSSYDLLHLFNIIRPEFLIEYIDLGIPFVVSTIYVDYRETDLHTRGPVFKLLHNVVGKFGIEYIKVIARHFSGKSRAPFTYIKQGQRGSIKAILQGASGLLPNSQSEANRILADFPQADQIQLIRRIPNGIDTKTFINEPKTERQGVLCVARFEHLKNQLNLIRAIQQTELKLTLVGDPSPNQAGYYQQCVSEVAKTPDQIQIINALPSEKLPELYAKSKVHVLPSWFETTGLVNLEAAAAGCQVVISSKGDTHEYFKDLAFYCDPASVSSIQSAIQQAYETPVDPNLKKHILAHFTWSIAAEKTLEAYKEVING